MRLGRLALACALSTFASEALAQSKIQATVEQDLTDDASARVVIITKSDLPGPFDGQPQSTPKSYVSTSIGKPPGLVVSLPSISGVATRVSSEQLDRLRVDPNVVAVLSNIPVPPLTDKTVVLVGANRAHDKGFWGDKQTVAILDTGLDVDHPAFKGGVAAEACFSTTGSGANPSLSLCPNGLDMSVLAGAAGLCPSQVAGCDHGTHVAGIVAARSATYEGRRLAGMSPSAKVIPIQVFSLFTGVTDCGAVTPCVLSYPADQARALEWVEKHHAEFGIVAVNLSLGGGYFGQTCDGQSPLSPIIARLKAVGVLTVIAAGNSAYYDGVSMPGCISSAITVAATKKNGEIDYAYSNISPLVDVFAPGTEVFSTLPGKRYGAKSGTSMAAPHVAGAVALLHEEYPTLTGTALEKVLEIGAPEVIDQRTGDHYPRLDLIHTLTLASAPAAMPAALVQAAQTTPSSPTDTPVTSAPAAAATPTTSEVEPNRVFLLETKSSPSDVQKSVDKVCPNGGCDLKKIGDQAWRLTLPTAPASTTFAQPPTESAVEKALDLPAGAEVRSNATAATPVPPLPESAAPKPLSLTSGDPP